MAWTKAKTALVAAVIVLGAGTAVLVLKNVASSSNASRRQVLEDGSVLTLDRVVVDSRARFIHGTSLSKLLGNLIPSNGVHLLKINLNRPSQENFDSWGKSWLVVQLRLTGPNATNHPLVKPAFFREFRFVIYGEHGIEFVEELWRGKFLSYPDGFYGYIIARSFPRDSSWLGLRVERRQNQDEGGPWRKVADLRIQNPAHPPAIQPWVAEPAPVIKSVGGMDFVLGKVTVQTIPYMPHDIWNHIVTAPIEVRSNGVVLTNWSAPYGNLEVEDASGNWDTLASHRSLDPRYVWKLEADFEPIANFSSEQLATIRLPARGSSVTTNVMNVPVTVTWDGYYVDASMPTNRPDLVLRFVAVSDDAGQSVSEADHPSGSWDRYRFRKGSFMARKGNVLTTDFKPTTLTFVLVPSVHATFYTQPQLIDEKLNK